MCRFHADLPSSNWSAVIWTGRLVAAIDENWNMVRLVRLDRPMIHMEQDPTSGTLRVLQLGSDTIYEVEIRADGVRHRPALGPRSKVIKGFARDEERDIAALAYEDSIVETILRTCHRIEFKAKDVMFQGQDKVVAVSEDGKVMLSASLNGYEVEKRNISGWDVLVDTNRGETILMKKANTTEEARRPKMRIGDKDYVFSLHTSQIDRMAGAVPFPVARAFDAKFGTIWELSLNPPAITVLNPNSEKGRYQTLGGSMSFFYDPEAEHSGIIVNYSRAERSPASIWAKVGVHVLLGVVIGIVGVGVKMAYKCGVRGCRKATWKIGDTIAAQNAVQVPLEELKEREPEVDDD